MVDHHPMHQRWKEASNAFFVGVLLLTSVAVMSAVLTVAWSTYKVSFTLAQDGADSPAPDPAPAPDSGGGADSPAPAPDSGGGTAGTEGLGTTTEATPQALVNPMPTPRPASAVRASEAVQLAAKATVALVTATSVSVAPVAATIAVGSAIVTATTAASAVPGGLLGLLQAFMPFLSVRRRRLPIGRVVEEGANLPIAGAAVTILDTDGKPRQTVRSKSDGGFTALLPRGQYLLAVNHPGYTLSTHPHGVALFPEERLYTGTPVTVTGEEAVLPLVLGLTPSGKRRSRSLGARLRPLVERLRVLQACVAIPVVLLGAAVNSLALWQRPTPLLIAFEVLYGVLLSIELLLSRVMRRAIGRVRDALRRAPVALAMVRLVDAKTQRLVATRVTSPQGQFLLMPPPGQYLLQVIHTSYVPYTKMNFEIGKGIMGAARVRVDLQPRGSSGP